MTITKATKRIIIEKTPESYIARILGTSAVDNFTREPVETTWSAIYSDEAQAKPEQPWLESAEVGPGLYEIQNRGRRYYRVVFLHENVARFCDLSMDRASVIASRMSSGEPFEKARKEAGR